ncbi:MAG TPA: hypothetical protein PLG59_12190, partial [bacterium]|nr:hypothetical protein [bacterium]
VPIELLYFVLGAIVIVFLLNGLIHLVRYLERVGRASDKYNKLIEELGISRAEKSCLKQCYADLGIKDRYKFLDDPHEFERALQWAEKRPSRKMLIGRIQGKLEVRRAKEFNPFTGPQRGSVRSRSAEPFAV